MRQAQPERFRLISGDLEEGLDSVATVNTLLKRSGVDVDGLVKRHVIEKYPRSEIPQRYGVNLARYRERGGAIDLPAEVELFIKGSENNKQDLSRLYALCLAFDQIEHESIAGDMAELGVYKGHTAVVLARFARRTERHLYLLDTFSGFAEEDLAGPDQTQQMQFQDTDFDAVRSFVGDGPVSYVRGKFPDTADQLPNEGRYALVHIDCDLYAPIKAGLEYFYPRMTPGGFLIIHDYSSLYWPGAEQAIDEFFADKPESVIPMPDISGTVVVRRCK